MVSALEADGGKLTAMPVHSKNPLVMLANTVRLVRLVRKEGVSLIHVRSRAPAFAALWAAKMTGVPLVATYHGVYRAQNPLKRWYNAIMTRGDLVIANSDYTRSHVLSEHHLDPRRIISIPRGVNLEWFDAEKVAPERVEALRRAWGISANDRRLKLLLAGRLTRLKGHLTVIAAAAKLKAQGQEGFLILFVGDDHQGRSGYRAEVEAAIAAADLGDQIRIVGHCDDMPAAYLLADVAILPSTQPESFGRTAVEPQAMGRPVIASDHGGTVETVVEGHTGWRVAPGDAAAWAKGIEVVLATGPAGLAAMGVAAAERANRLYSVNSMCAGTLGAYERVLKARGSY